MHEGNLKQKTKLAVYWNFIQNLSVQGLSFVFGIILARLLSPSDFGILAMPAIFIALGNVFINSGFNTALIRKPNLTDDDLSTAFYFNTLMGLACAILLFVCSPYIANFYNQPILSDTLKVSSISMFLGAFQSVHYVRFNRNLDFKTPAKINVISTILSGIIGISLAYLGYGIWSLVIQGIAGLIITTVLIWYYSKWRPNTKWSKQSFRYLWCYGNKVMLSSILDTINDNLYPLVIGKFYSARDLGVYRRARSYAELPFNQVSGIIQSIAFPVLSKLQDDKEALMQNFSRILNVSLFVLCPLLLGISALAEPLVIVLISEKWESCVPLLELICFPIILWPIQTLNMTIYKVLGRTDYLLWLNVFIKVSSLIIIIIIVLFYLDKGVVYVAYGTTIHSILAVFVSMYATGKLTGWGITKQFTEIIKVLFLGIVMYIAIKFVIRFVETCLLKLVIGFITGVIIYFGLSIVFRLRQLEDLKYLLQVRKQ